MIGIIGGGQLCKMMVMEAKKMGLRTAALDPEPRCPAHGIADVHIVAAFDDRQAFEDLTAQCDVLTYEFEHIDAAALRALERRGAKVYPTAASLEVIQDKQRQKEAMAAAGIPVPAFLPAESAEDVRRAGETFGYPLMLKNRAGGYDGKGNVLVEDENEIEQACAALSTGGKKRSFIVEAYVRLLMEISVLACRSVNGEVRVYPVAMNHHEDSILVRTVVPAPLPDSVSESAMALASDVMDVFRGVGMFCVEMFVQSDHTLLVNEVAPRPHNSGHYTIEACVTSQFENHIRAMAGLPLGDPSLVKPAAMRNILGRGAAGPAKVLGMEKALGIPGAKVHIYGKEISKPQRKMGHLTVTAADAGLAAKLADEAAALIVITS